MIEVTFLMFLIIFSGVAGFLCQQIREFVKLFDRFIGLYIDSKRYHSQMTERLINQILDAAKSVIECRPADIEEKE